MVHVSVIFGLQNNVDEDKTLSLQTIFIVFSLAVYGLFSPYNNRPKRTFAISNVRHLASSRSHKASTATRKTTQLSLVRSSSSLAMLQSWHASLHNTQAPWCKL